MKRATRTPQAMALAIAIAFGIASGASLSGCGGDAMSSGAAAETLAPRAWLETLAVDGEIKAAASTPLNVPGNNWSQRMLIDMVADGSSVEQGQVVARFDSPQSRMELSQAELELLRKTLAEQASASAAQVERDKLAGDRAKVEDDLGLSRRYASVDLSIFPRNDILDALADVGFLTTKRTYLEWKGGQAQARTAAQDAVLHSQRDSVLRTAAQQRDSLAALELVAPHDGVFLLTAKWDGTKAEIGSTQVAGQEFGSLPDLNQLVAHFSVAEGQVFGLKAGLPVRVRLAGTGTELALKVTRVGSNASTTSQESPVKYSDFDAAIDTATARRLGLKPGQALRGTVELVARPAALTVPNIALVQDGAGYVVYTEEAGKQIRHKVELGQRGPVRSELKSGVAAGARIVLLPPASTEKS
ncbi:Multidrug efflux pump subunit AcrA (membrane-fusion protein) [Duganella sp. CF517]|uniref:efflux RND transporter periplasmic adaptor subunit n=1 Tax=Duganella sp. CF517 TaxID=1881038 RepID=UPI0008B15962|nr:secretion protein HlyD [Duganella sp. CF517]SEO47828.1 Multidrug efflux pump subunit AcrA (membrane-fusion protein) [Duganella sp. CF517]